MKPRSVMALVVLASAVWVVGAATHLWAEANSHVRIVRLSFAEGTVTVQRPDVTGWTTAPVNTPIQEGFALSTGKDSFAEVEFENGSTVRIGELSILEFTELSLAPSGSKVNRLTFNQGYATFHVNPEPDDVNEVNIAQAKLTPSGKGEFRTDLDGDTLRVEVFKGAVEFSGPQGTVMLAKNKVLETSTTTEEAYQVTHGITKDSWDEWVAERDDVQTSNRAPSAYSTEAAGTNYGWADLNAYGNWSYLPGYGYGWIPSMYTGWSPFTIGRWVWYPAFGYTWISYEPWGWLPYHYGDWLFHPMLGWAWFPGTFGSWCPAQVTWYQGPGWVGWAPRTPATGPRGGSLPGTGAGGLRGCPGPGCIRAVPVQALEGGKLITPTSVTPIDVAHAVQVPKPDVPPAIQARFTGAPLPAAPSTRASVGRGAQGFSNVQRPSGVWHSAPSALAGSGRAPSALADSGRSNRGLNRPGPTSSALPRSAPSFSGSSLSNPGLGVASRPAPRSGSSASFGAVRSGGGSGFGAVPSRSGGTVSSPVSSGSVSSGSIGGGGGGGSRAGSGGGGAHR